MTSDYTIQKLAYQMKTSNGKIIDLSQLHCAISINGKICPNQVKHHWSMNGKTVFLCEQHLDEAMALYPDSGVIYEPDEPNDGNYTINRLISDSLKGIGTLGDIEDAEICDITTNDEFCRNPVTKIWSLDGLVAFVCEQHHNEAIAALRQLEGQE